MRALITGGSRGIGRAIALRLGRDGATVLLSYLRNKDAAEAVCEEVRALGGQASSVPADVRSPAALQQLAWEAEQRLGGIDLLVHNAAMGALKPFDQLRVSHWDLTLETSLRPFWLLTKLTLPLLAEGSSVIGISSLGSRRHTPGYAAMGAAKGGMEALVRQLAVELAPRVRVNAVVGGLIETDALEYLPQAEELREFTRKATPLGRVGVPEDIAGAVALLASPDARWINGQVIVADGGLSAV